MNDLDIKMVMGIAVALIVVSIIPSLVGGAAPANGYTITIQAGAHGTTNPPPGSYTYPAGTQVGVAAHPDSGYRLDHWELGGVGYTGNPITVGLTASCTLVAVFVELEPGETPPPSPPAPPSDGVGDVVEYARQIVLAKYPNARELNTKEVEKIAPAGVLAAWVDIGWSKAWSWPPLFPGYDYPRYTVVVILWSGSTIPEVYPFESNFDFMSMPLNNSIHYLTGGRACGAHWYGVTCGHVSGKSLYVWSLNELTSFIAAAEMVSYAPGWESINPEDQPRITFFDRNCPETTRLVERAKVYGKIWR